MMRWLLCAAIVIAFSGQAAAIDIWLSASDSLSPGSSLPAGAGAVPKIHRFPSQPGGSFFVWARPDNDIALENWSLRLTSSDLSILTFTPSAAVAKANIEAYNATEPGHVRWEHVVGLAGNQKEIDLFGFSLLGTPPRIGDGIGEGFGKTCADGQDQFCDSTSNSWLLAKIDYTLSGVAGQTELFFQIGAPGINNKDEASSLAFVRFGDGTDGMLNGESDRLTFDSNSNADGVIVVHPDLVKDGNGFDAADFDIDHDVDGRDFLTWQRGFGKTGINATKANGNANNDSIVDAIDLAAWQFQYGSVTPLIGELGITVPEPATGLFAASLFVLVFATRCRSASVRHQKSGRANS